ncbi:TadE family protein [Calycomorphotria hydatis]|uniref:TadE-like protein n=1 Tax=Calycomorphotria hydatis TaxID=2528027 RepID=A0A517TAH8_9PLAN|nr:TadE family protein [Calycomorphotria hydatis]QDT65379.1 TadE-like protein [Calycomorphotria hydatis]
MKHLLNHNSKSSRSTRRRAGFLSVELIFALPIFLLIGAALVEMGMLMQARGAVVDAARVGARHASYLGVDKHDVVEHTRKTLGPRLGYHADVVVEQGEQTGEPVIVAVRVPMGAAAPNLLWPFGFNTENEYLVAEVRMARE